MGTGWRHSVPSFKYFTNSESPPCAIRSAGAGTFIRNTHGEAGVFRKARAAEPGGKGVIIERNGLEYGRIWLEDDPGARKFLAELCKETGPVPPLR